jgi:hypothetical protein
MPHSASPAAASEPSDAPDGEHETPARAAQSETKGDWWDHCPLCGARLRNRGCKYRCPRCRYFMSCSDFD